MNINIKRVTGEYKAAFEAAIGLMEYLERVLPKVMHYNECPDKYKLVNDIVETVASTYGPAGWDTFISEQDWHTRIIGWAEELIYEQIEQECINKNLTPEERLLKEIFGDAAKDTIAFEQLGWKLSRKDPFETEEEDDEQS